MSRDRLTIYEEWTLLRAEFMLLVDSGYTRYRCTNLEGLVKEMDSRGMFSDLFIGIYNYKMKVTLRTYGLPFLCKSTDIDCQLEWLSYNICEYEVMYLEKYYKFMLGNTFRYVGYRGYIDKMYESNEISNDTYYYLDSYTDDLYYSGKLRGTRGRFRNFLSLVKNISNDLNDKRICLQKRTYSMRVRTL